MAYQSFNLAKLSSISSRQRITVNKLFHYIESNPIIDISKTALALGLSYNTVSNTVNILEEKGILRKTDKSGRTTIYAYTEYLDILRKNT